MNAVFRYRPMIDRLPLKQIRLAGQPALLGSIVPTFEVELRQGNEAITGPAIFDTGMQWAHGMVPKQLAEKLGIVVTGKMEQRTVDGLREVSIGKLDLIRVPGIDGCSLVNGKVIIGGDKIWIGQSFLAATGATIFYERDGVKLNCSGNPSPAVGVYPQFSFDLTNKGRLETVTAILDTGFELGLAVPANLAEKLGLEETSYENAATPSGKIKVGVSKIDRISFTGHPKCHADGLKVMVYPENSPMQKVLVGEEFLKKLPVGRIDPGDVPFRSSVGYDKDGAYAVCRADESAIRAAKTVYLVTVPPDMLPDPSKPALLVPAEGAPRWPWIVGGAIAAGVVGYLVWR